MKKIMLIDDVRDISRFWPLDDGAKLITHRTYQDGIDGLIAEDGEVDSLFLDHDLGCFDEHGTEKTGYDILLFLEEYPEYMPKDIVAVTGNIIKLPVMREKITELYNRRALDIAAFEVWLEKQGIIHLDERVLYKAWCEGRRHYGDSSLQV